MTTAGSERLAFNVDTARILQILASEIYDSPKAFLRENVQNAYDAILMRCTAQNLSVEDRRIEITVDSSIVAVQDDGIGMEEDVLANNFWKAGSSGKKSALAQRSGVIGTFGIGAMANFGVCSALRVETRHMDSDVTLITSANRDTLAIAEKCIDLSRISDKREPGTRIVANLDSSNRVSESVVCDYLKQYVRFLPVPVLVNGRVISQESFADTASSSGAGFDQIFRRRMTNRTFAGMLEVSVNPQGRVFVRITDIDLNGTRLEGEACLVQDGGSTHAYRNFFGLAPVPVSGHYRLGGYVNLNILRPTAGREALSRDSIQHISNLVNFVEEVCSLAIADHAAADINQQFQRHILAKGKTELAKNVRIFVRPSEAMVPLADVSEYQPDKSKHYYTGTDPTTLTRFASEGSNLLQVSQNNPRRELQMKYLTRHTKIDRVPERTLVDRIPATELTLDEAMFLVRLRGVLLDDYVIGDVEISLADISHGVEFHTEAKGDTLQEIAISRTAPAVRMVVECYRTARDVFSGFVKDFVREHLYPHIRPYILSSTQQGRDALYQRLKANKELFQLQESDYGEIEEVLTDYISGKTDFNRVLTTAGMRRSSQWQRVSGDQVGSVEKELPDIIDTDIVEEASGEFDARPPIERSDAESEMKVLTVSDAYPMLNNFRMFLALSDRLAKTEGGLLNWPHTTKVLWGSHRVIYIFADETGDISLYYDIELTAPLDSEQTGGSMLPTTTIVTGNRIFVPVPSALEPAFRVIDSAKDYYVRFDTIP